MTGSDVHRRALAVPRYWLIIAALAGVAVVALQTETPATTTAATDADLDLFDQAGTAEVSDASPATSAVPSGPEARSRLRSETTLVDDALLISLQHGGRSSARAATVDRFDPPQQPGTDRPAAADKPIVRVIHPSQATALPSQEQCRSKPVAVANERPIGSTEPSDRFILTPVVMDAFDDRQLLGRTLSGQWRLGEGRLEQIDDAGFDYITGLDLTPPTNYSVGVTVQALGDRLGAGLVIGQTNDQIRHGAVVIDFTGDGDYIRWGCYDDRTGEYHFLGGRELGPDFDPTEPHHVRVTVVDRVASVSVDDRLVGGFEITTSGHVGLITNRSHAAFDDVDLCGLREIVA